MILVCLSVGVLEGGLAVLASGSGGWLGGVVTGGRLAGRSVAGRCG